ncbi:hypothetical protein GGGNBK_13925 [Sporosarcina sp. ANT_H38]
MVCSTVRVDAYFREIVGVYQNALRQVVIVVIQLGVQIHSFQIHWLTVIVIVLSHRQQPNLDTA